MEKPLSRAKHKVFSRDRGKTQNSFTFSDKKFKTLYLLAMKSVRY